MNLIFRPSVGGKILAKAYFDTGDCPPMDLTIAGVEQDRWQTNAFTRQVLGIAGLRLTYDR